MGVANTTFIMTYARLMRDLPFERPERVAIVRTLDGRGREGGVSYPDFEDFRQDSQVFDGRAAAFAINTISLGRDGAVPEQFDGLYVSADTFTVLRVTPVIGRDFSAADDSETLLIRTRATLGRIRSYRHGARRRGGEGDRSEALGRTPGRR